MAKISVLLAPQTGAGNSAEFTQDSSRIPSIVRTTGTHAGAETSQVQYQDNAGAWQSFTSLRGGAVTNGQLSTTVNLIPIFEPGRYRVAKGATAGAVGIELITEG